jgi:hypothetical protein
MQRVKAPHDAFIIGDTSEAFSLLHVAVFSKRPEVQAKLESWIDAILNDSMAPFPFFGGEEATILLGGLELLADHLSPSSWRQPQSESMLKQYKTVPALEASDFISAT